MINALRKWILVPKYLEDDVTSQKHTQSRGTALAGGKIARVLPQNVIITNEKPEAEA